ASGPAHRDHARRRRAARGRHRPRRFVARPSSPGGPAEWPRRRSGRIRIFTGIVEELGEIRAVAPKGDVLRLDVAARATLEGSGLGASLAVNGVCLTAVETRPDGLAFDVGPETLARTTLGTLKVGEAVNLERPLRFGAAVG